MSDIVYLTKEKFIELENELRDMKINGRAQVAGKIAEARGHGDLSENAEYDAAKEEQRHLEYRISKIEETLSKSRIIESKDLPNDKVYILSKVKVKDSKTGKTIEYQLVSPEEANFESNKLSVTSPIGKGLMGKKAGDVVEIIVPAGKLKYSIVEISR
ncbi:MAG: transcription elongation factor GreA [Bacteroidota bacterium]|jgi:transcription elongation factor GreA